MHHCVQSTNQKASRCECFQYCGVRVCGVSGGVWWCEWWCEWWDECATLKEVRVCNTGVVCDICSVRWVVRLVWFMVCGVCSTTDYEWCLEWCLEWGLDWGCIMILISEIV